MKIILNTNSRIRKLININNLFGPPDSVSRKMLHSPEFFGKDFLQASKIYSKMNAEIKNHGQNKFWKSFLDENVKAGSLSVMLDALSVLEENDKSPKLKKIASESLKNFSNHEPEIKKLLKSVFGFELPSKIHLVVDVASSEFSSNGSSVSYNPTIISIKVPSYKAKVTTLILHELLHSAINSSKIVPEDEKLFTEALISYFAPSGIIDQKLGIIEDKGISGIANHIRETQPYYTSKVNILEKPLGTYTSTHFGKITVWHYLKKVGFNFIKA